MKTAPVIWDAETHLIKPGMTAPRLVCAAFEYADGSARLLARDEALDEAERILEEETFGNHHVFFDLGVLAAERPRTLPGIFRALDDDRVHCTKIRQMMIDNARGELKFVWDEEKLEYKKQHYPLWKLVQKHLHEDIRGKKEGENAWRLRYHELEGVPLEAWPEEAREYPLGDSSLTKEVWLAQEKDISPDEIPGYASQMQTAWALNLMGTWGMRTDPAAVASYKKELEIELAEQVRICQQYGFRRKSGSRDMKAIRAAVESWYRDHDREMKLTKGGKKTPPQVATDREQLTDTDHPGLLAVAGSVTTEKRLTTYIAALERGTVVPLNPNYNPIIETFRTSCSGGMKIDGVPVGMNVQNLPRKGKVRECVVPREGWAFAFCDYDTLEMRTLAQVCLDLFGYSEIAHALREGVDPHIALAAEILEVSYRDLVDAYVRGDAEASNARQFSKIGNYGLGGGMGPRAFIQYAKGYGIEVSMDLAKKIHGSFRRRWSEMRSYFEHCSFLCGEGNAEQIVFVRTGMVRGDVPYTATCNGFFQHLAAIGAKKALYEVARECYVDRGSPLFGCRPWLFAHDEIGMEIPYKDIGPRKAHEAAERLQQVMIECMSFWCPDVPIGATVAMTRRWYKGAKPIQQGGILVPCRPQGKGWVADA